MKLYSNAFAPSPRRVRMFAAEKGLTLETVNLDFANNPASCWNGCFGS